MVSYISPFDQVYHATLKTSGVSLSDQQIIAQLVDDDPIRFIDNKLFHKRSAQHNLFKVLINMDHAVDVWHRMYAADFINDVQYLSAEKLIHFTREEERLAFLQFNYARFRINKLQILSRANRGNLPPLTNPEKIRLLKWHKVAKEARCVIIIANLGLPGAMIKKYRRHDNSYVDHTDLISEGNLAIERAINLFDIDRGFKFSTYACRAILKAFFRHVGKEQKFHERMIGVDIIDEYTRSQEAHSEETDRHLIAKDMSRILKASYSELSLVEKQVIDARYPQDNDTKPLTLLELGEIIGLTKERVRQIQNIALRKMRECFDLDN